jgi:hypothetical protein
MNAIIPDIIKKKHTEGSVVIFRYILKNSNDH